MYSAAEVDKLFQEWKSQGQTKEQLIINTAKAELGWPYGWGAVGSVCTPEKRRYYSQRSQCPEQDAKNLIDRCQALSGKRPSCLGCEFFPADVTGLNDCQGFVKQVCQRVGITFAGGGCTSMWDSNSNWSEKGTKDKMPNQLCLAFQWSNKNQNMQHVGIHIADGVIIECAKTVRYAKLSDPAWTHYAIPRGLGGDTPMPWRPTIRKGSRGEDVKYVQEILIKLGYDLGASGADGIFGNKTVAAVKAFQKANGLVADGVVGPMTYEALDNVDPGPDPSTTLYTVQIPHLTLYQAEALKDKYVGAIIIAEVGDD